MSNQLILFTGGARSGKSAASEKMTQQLGKKHYYIATAPCLDSEMADRIARHKAQRATAQWVTIEEELDLEHALTQATQAGAESVLVDCLTLWINNLLYHTPEITEAMMAERTEHLMRHVRTLPCHVVFVINEVGLGIVPENEITRRFRDLSGRCAQIVAREADAVYFMIAGIQQKIKP